MVVPDKGETDSDHKGESRPDRAEDPIGRFSGGMVEGGIPVGNGSGSHEPAKAAKNEHGEGAEDDFCGK